MKRSPFTLCTLAVIAAILQTGCSTQSPTGLQTLPQDGNLVGTVCTAKGKPVKNATVVLASANYTPLNAPDDATIDSVRSDDNGTYSFSVRQNGIYNLFAEGNDLFGMHKSIQVSTSGHLELAQASLTAPGSISGVVHLADTGDSRSAVVLLPGTNKYVRPEKNGTFTIGSLAEGSYAVRFLDISATHAGRDTVITVASGEETVLPAISLEKSHTPNVTYFTTAYSSLLMEATLTWTTENMSTADSVFIYCNRKENLSPLRKLFSTATSAVIDCILSEGDTLLFQISVKGQNGWISEPVSCNPVFVTSAFSQSEPRPISYKAWDRYLSVFNDSTPEAYDHYWYVSDEVNESLYKIGSDFSTAAQYALPGGTSLFPGIPLSFDNRSNIYCITFTFDSTAIRNDIFKFDTDLNLLQTSALDISAAAEYQNDISMAVSSDGAAMIYLPISTRKKEGSDILVDSTIILIYDSDMHPVSADTIPGCYRILESRTDDHAVVALMEKKQIALETFDFNGRTISAELRSTWRTESLVLFDNNFNRITTVSPEPDAAALHCPEGFEPAGTYSQLGPKGYVLRTLYNTTATGPLDEILLFINCNGDVIARMPANSMRTGYNRAVIVDIATGGMYCEKGRPADEQPDSNCAYFTEITCNPPLP